MFSHFSIGRKISLGFAIVILSTIVAFYITNTTFVESQEINEEITNNHTPSIAKLEELKLMIVRSKMLISNWVYLPSPSENEDKVLLNRLTVSDYPNLKLELEELSQRWDDSTRATLDPLFDNIEMLWSNHEFVKQALNSLDNYNEPMNLFMANSMVEEGGDIDNYTDQTLDMLQVLIDNKKEVTKVITATMIESFKRFDY